MTQAGGEGVYQRRMYLIFMVVLLTNGLLAFMLPYIYFEPDFYCKDESGVLTKCPEAEACVSEFGFTTSSPRSSIVTINELWCDRRILKFSAISFINFSASIVSTILISASDSVGRVKVLYLALVMLLIGLLAAMFVTEFYVNVFLNSVIWLSCDIFMAVSFVYMFEITTGEYRNRSNQILYIVFSTGVILYNAANAGFGRLYLVYVLPFVCSIISIPFVCKLKETPWMLMRIGKFDEFRKLVLEIKNCNYPLEVEGDEGVVICYLYLIV